MRCDMVGQSHVRNADIGGGRASRLGPYTVIKLLSGESNGRCNFCVSIEDKA